MAVKIDGICKNSIAEECGIEKGDIILEINGNVIEDYLDYRFYLSGEYLEILIKKADGNEFLFEIEKYEDEELGIEFDNYLSDGQKSCKNKCIFCFIDQLPKGLRKTLYFKDDDARMSFLMGNYVTLTNLDEKHLEKIIRMKISPINVSVHTTNPELRVFMMKNPKAAEIMDTLKRFSDNNITLNCQIVLCKDINDKDELMRTMKDLRSLNVNSVSIVPVGISAHRENLYPMKPFNAEDCSEIIDMVESFAKDTYKKYKSRKFYLSDEFYIKAKRELPSYEYYEDFPQIENGVGMIRNFEKEIYEKISSLSSCSEKRHISLVTGEIMSSFINKYIDDIKEKWYNLKCNVFPIKNNFFGGEINVTGLVTGGDIISQLKDKDLGEMLLIPESMLRFERDMFLDDVTLKELSEKLNIKTVIVSNDGYDFVEKIIGEV